MTIASSNERTDALSRPKENADQMLDDTNTVGNDSAVIETTIFDASFPLFDAYSAGETSNSTISAINGDGATLNDES